MTRKLPVALCSLALAAAGGVAVSGCGAEEVAGVDVAKAANATAAQKTARMQMTMEMSGMGLPAPVTITADGVTDLRKPRGTITLDFGQMLSALGAPAGFAGADPKLTIQFDGASVDVHVPEIKQLTAFLGGKRWIHADLAQLAKALGFDASGFGKLAGISPSQQLAMLKAAGDFKQVGTETVAGAKTTHYKGSYTFSALIKQLPASARKQLEQLFDRLGTKLPDTKNVAEIWVDAKGLMRKITVASDIPTGAAGMPKASMKITCTLSEFGVPVTLAKPPASDTYTVTPETIQRFFARAALAS